MKKVSLTARTNRQLIHINDITSDMFLRTMFDKHEDNNVFDFLLDQRQIDKVKDLIIHLTDMHRAVYQFDSVEDMTDWERTYLRYR